MTEITRETCANCGRDRYKGTGPSWMTQHWPKVDLYSLHAPDCAINTPGKLPGVTVTSIWPDHNWQPATLDEVRGIRDVCVWKRETWHDVMGKHGQYYETACGATDFLHITPGEHGVNFCPYCGKALEAG